MIWFLLIILRGSCLAASAAAWLGQPLVEQQGRNNKQLRRGAGKRDSHFQNHCTPQVSFRRVLPPVLHSCSLLSFHQWPFRFTTSEICVAAAWRGGNGFYFFLLFSPRYGRWFCSVDTEHWHNIENIRSIVSLLFYKSQSNRAWRTGATSSFKTVLIDNTLFLS